MQINIYDNSRMWYTGTFTFNSVILIINVYDLCVKGLNIPYFSGMDMKR